MKKFRKYKRWKKGKKKRRCPICGRRFKRYVRYHVSYSPEFVIMACRRCNQVEWKLRHNLLVGNEERRRVERIKFWREKSKRILENWKKQGIKVYYMH